MTRSLPEIQQAADEAHTAPNYTTGCGAVHASDTIRLTATSVIAVGISNRRQQRVSGHSVSKYVEVELKLAM